MKDDCVGIVGYLFGHIFKARFDERRNGAKWPWPPGESECYLACDVQEILETTRDVATVYVCDVCLRCGEVIHRDVSLKGEQSRIDIACPKS